MSASLAVYQPQNLQDAQALAKMWAGAGLVPQAFRGKPNDILLMMARGADLGMSPVQSLHAFYVISGRVGMYADAMIGVCLSKPFCKYFRLVSTDDNQAIYETLREGMPEPVRMTYTMEQAKKAGLTASNQNYQKHPAAQLRARCGAALARVAYPDLVAGIYEPSELEEATAPRPVAPDYSGAQQAAHLMPPADVVAMATAIAPEPVTGEIWEEHAPEVTEETEPDAEPEEEIRMPEAVPNLGGKRLSELTVRDLKYWAGAFDKSAQKPDKARWRDQNEKLAAGCLAELERRNG